MNADPNPNERHKGFTDSTPLADPDQEAERIARLAEQWAEVDRHERLVCYFAGRYRTRTKEILHVEDLKSAGRLGALKAVQRRDPDMNDRQWKRFLALWIHRSIQDEITHQATPIRLPSYENRKRIQRDRPQHEAFAALRKILDHPILDVSLERNSPPSQRPEPLDSLIAREEWFTLQHAVEALPNHERITIESCFGIGCDPRKMPDVARQEGITLWGVHLRKRSALKRLRRVLDSRF